MGGTSTLPNILCNQVSQQEPEVNTSTPAILNEDQGASMVEYALLLILIAIVAIVGVQVAGQEVSNAFSTVADGFTNPN